MSRANPGKIAGLTIGTLLISSQLVWADCKPVDYYTRSAKIYLQLKEPDTKRALNILSEGFNCYPQDPEINYHMGNIYAEQHRYAKMMEHYTAAEKYKTKQKDFTKNISDTKQSVWGQLFQEGLDLLKADTSSIDSLNRSVRVNAKQRFSDAILIDSNRYESFVNMGVLYIKLNHRDSAVSYYEVAHRLNPKDVSIAASLAGSYFNEKKYEDAIQIYQEIVAIDPQNKDAYSTMASAWAQLNNNEKVKQNYYKILELDPFDKDVLHNLGLFCLHELSDSVHALEKKIGKTARDTAAFNTHLEKLGEKYYPAAESLFSRAAQADSTDKESIYYAGYCNLRMGNVDRALQYQLKAVALDSTFKEAYLDLAIIYMKKGLVEKAQQAQEKAHRK